MADAIVPKPEIIYCYKESHILKLQLQDIPSVESLGVTERVVLGNTRLRLTSQAGRPPCAFRFRMGSQPSSPAGTSVVMIGRASRITV